MLKPGSRHRSQVCETEVIVVRPADINLTCGGHPMVPLGDEPDASLTLDPKLSGGAPIGKRFTDATGALEVLVTKAGAGTLADGTTPLEPREAKTLPSSD